MKLTAKDLIERLPHGIVEALIKCEQSKNHHKEGSVFNHTILVVENAIRTKNDNVIIAAVFHDIGKLDATTITEVDGKVKVSSHGHEKESVKYLKHLNRYPDFEFDEEAVHFLVRNHMRAHKYVSGEMSKKSKREELENSKYFKELLILQECDSEGRM